MQLILVDKIMYSVYERVKVGIYYDGNYKPYSKDFLDKVLNFYQEKERYEECKVIRDIIKIRFNHDDVSNFRNF